MELKPDISRDDFTKGLFDSPGIAQKEANQESTKGQGDIAKDKIHLAHEIDFSEKIHSSSGKG